jgi:hypothetical protein
MAKKLTDVMVEFERNDLFYGGLYIDVDET